MRLTLVILMKDLRRLWWEAAVAMAALAVLTYLDARRYDFVPTPTEAMLNFLVPAVWTYLVAMLVHQEILVGDRHFWLTRPYPRTALLAAKLLAVAFLIHLPALVSDCLILWTHEFPPLHYLPQLAGKQALIGSVVVLPALALASLTKSLPQFAFLAALAALAGALLLSGFEPQWVPWIDNDSFRRVAGLLVNSIGAALALSIQYISRRTTLARTVAVVTFASAALLFIYLPPSGPATAATGEPGNISVAVSRTRSYSQMPERPGLVRQIYIPVDVSAGPLGSNPLLRQVSLSLKTEGGKTWSMSSRPIFSRSGALPFHGWLTPEFQMLAIPHHIFETVVRQPVTVEGVFNAIFAQTRTASIPVQTGLVPIAGLGNCMSGLADPGLLRVMCESPGSVPRSAVVVRRASGTIGRRQQLGDSAPAIRYPLTPWLSPLNRRQTFFHLREEVPRDPGTEWLIPAGALAGSEIELQYSIETRRVTSQYRLGPLNLADYLPSSSRGSMNLR